MNLITTLGGVIGVLIGAAVIGIVVAVGLLPLVFVSRANELREPDEELNDHLNDNLRDAHSRMSAHV